MLATSSLILSLCALVVHSSVLTNQELSLDTKRNNPPAAGLGTNVHQSSCGSTDSKCWSKKGVEYMNKVRSDRGINTMLTLGTESQFDNAQGFAEKLAGEGDLYHQDLGKASEEVGCGRLILGETAAMNGAGGDVARSCVDQWIGSPPHLDIMLGGYEEAVVGFGFRGGTVYCIATFAVKSDSNAPSDGKCKAMGGMSSTSDGGSTPPAPAPEEPDTQEPTGSEPIQDAPVDEPGSSVGEPDSSTDYEVGRSSCRCIIKGKLCRKALESKTMNQCTSRTEGHAQSSGCKKQCCDYCRNRGSTRRCDHPKVKYVCS